MTNTNTNTPAELANTLSILSSIESPTEKSVELARLVAIAYHQLAQATDLDGLAATYYARRNEAARLGRAIQARLA